MICTVTKMKDAITVCPCGVRTKPMVTAKHPFGVRHDPGGGVDGDLHPFGKPNSNRRVPHAQQSPNTSSSSRHAVV